jgi:predicted AlkP superfamily phosphohydrolase/phosphomutase
MKERKLPTLREMMEEGAWGDLESTIHPLSPQAWASFMTGKNPGKHGIFEFVQHKPNSYDLHYVNGGFVQGRKLWEVLSHAGKRVCVVNVPLTYPPNAVNGCLVAGLDAPGPRSDFCYPPELLDELTQKFGEYKLRRNPYKAKPETYLQEILEQFDYVLKVAKYLKAKESWDLFVVVFEATDLVQHFYWHYAFPEEFGIRPPGNEILQEAIVSVYERIDQGLGELLDLCSTDETVMVMSDHGFSPCRKIFFMDKWLHEQGYLTYGRTDGKAYTLTRFLHLAFQKYFPNRFKDRIISRMPRLRDQMRSYLTTATIDWPRTKAFSLGIDSTNIFINLEGRFPDGIVPRGREYEELRQKIAEQLESLTDPSTEERIVQRVFKREELYHGDCLSKAPDLLVTWKDFAYNTRRGYGGGGNGLLGSSLEFSDVSGYSSLQKSGTHHVDGIFIARGPMVRNRDAFNGARIIDLAPTILYLLGESIPGDMDGRIIEDIIQDTFLLNNPIQHGVDRDSDRKTTSAYYNESEQEYIRDKLKGLGYID